MFIFIILYLTNFYKKNLMNDTSSFTSYDVKEEENSENPKISEEIKF